jgi:hypothetical protein
MSLRVNAASVAIVLFDSGESRAMRLHGVLRPERLLRGLRPLAMTPGASPAAPRHDTKGGPLAMTCLGFARQLGQMGLRRPPRAQPAAAESVRLDRELLAGQVRAVLKRCLAAGGPAPRRPVGSGHRSDHPGGAGGSAEISRLIAPGRLAGDEVLESIQQGNQPTPIQFSPSESHSLDSLDSLVFDRPDSPKIVAMPANCMILGPSMPLGLKSSFSQ